MTTLTLGLSLTPCSPPVLCRSIFTRHQLRRQPRVARGVARDRPKKVAAVATLRAAVALVSSHVESPKWKAAALELLPATAATLNTEALYLRDFVTAQSPLITLWVAAILYISRRILPKQLQRTLPQQKKMTSPFVFQASAGLHKLQYLVFLSAASSFRPHCLPRKPCFFLLLLSTLLPGNWDDSAKRLAMRPLSFAMLPRPRRSLFSDLFCREKDSAHKSVARPFSFLTFNKS